MKSGSAIKKLSPAEILQSAVKGTKQALPATIIITGIFFLNYFVFGPENASIGPVTALLFNKYKTRSGRYECLIMDFLICEVLAAAAFAANLNLLLNIIVNAAAFFWIACVYINDFSPANYFPIGIAYIFFQISPAETFGALANRAAALAVSFAILMLCLIAYTLAFSDYPAGKRMVTAGFENCRRQLELPEEDQAGRAALQTELHDICLQCCREAWDFNRSTIRPKNRSNFYCRYVSFFIIFNYLMDSSGSGPDHEQARMLYEKYREDFRTLKPRAIYERLHFRLDPLNLQDFRVRFALREAIVLVPCIAFARLSGLENIYWMVLCAFFLITPYSDLAGEKVKRRVIGTIIGVLLCQIAFPLLPTFGGRAVLMTVANFFSFVGGGYDLAVICITCAVTALSEIDGAVSVMLFQRLIYNLLGALIAVLANTYIFPIRTVNNLDYSSEYAERLQDEIEALAREIRHQDHPEVYFAHSRSDFTADRNGAGTAAGQEELSVLLQDAYLRKEIDQRLVRLFMLQARMEELDATLPDGDRHPDILNRHRRRMLEIAEVFAGKMLCED